MTKHLIVRLPDEVAADAEALARVEGKSLNETVKQSLIEAVERRRNSPKFKARLGQDHRRGSGAARTPRQVSIEYPDLADFIAIASAITGIDVQTLTQATKLDLADSALHAPAASFGGEEFYPDFCDKAAVLLVRLTKNHPLLEGNKRVCGDMTMTGTRIFHDRRVSTRKRPSHKSTGTGHFASYLLRERITVRKWHPGKLRASSVANAPISSHLPWVFSWAYDNPLSSLLRMSHHAYIA